MGAPIDYDYPTDQRTTYSSLELIAFSDADAAANAAPMMMARTADPPLFYAVEGTTEAAGVKATYRLEAVGFPAGVLQAPSLQGQVIFVVGSLAVRVSVTLEESFMGGVDYYYEYRDGYLVRSQSAAGTGGWERVFSMDTLAAQVQQLADITATVMLNRLRY